MILILARVDLDGVHLDAAEVHLPVCINLSLSF